MVGGTRRCFVFCFPSVIFARLAPAPSSYTSHISGPGGHSRPFSPLPCRVRALQILGTYGLCTFFPLPIASNCAYPRFFSSTNSHYFQYLNAQVLGYEVSEGMLYCWHWKEHTFLQAATKYEYAKPHFTYGTTTCRQNGRDAIKTWPSRDTPLRNPLSDLERGQIGSVRLGAFIPLLHLPRSR